MSTSACVGGGPTSFSENVTDAPGAKRLPRTMNAVLEVPWLSFTMHRPGPEPGWTVAHTVSGGTGIGGGPPEDVGVLELLSDAPRITPVTTRAAPTETQPTQARWLRSHCRQPPACRDEAGPVRCRAPPPTGPGAGW